MRPAKTIKAVNRPIVIHHLKQRKRAADAFLARRLASSTIFSSPRLDQPLRKESSKFHHPGIKRCHCWTTRINPNFYDIRDQQGLKKKPSTSRKCLNCV